MQKVHVKTTNVCLYAATMAMNIATRPTAVSLRADVPVALYTTIIQADVKRVTRDVNKVKSIVMAMGWYAATATAHVMATSAIMPFVIRLSDAKTALAVLRAVV
jgi:hypothetical protein